MKKFLCLLLLCSNALADIGEINFSWDAPTTRVNGDPLAIEDIEKYTIYFESGEVLADIAGGGSTQYVHEISLAGGESVCFQMTTWATATNPFTNELELTESQKTAIDRQAHCYTADVSWPGVPTNFRAVFSLGK